MRFIYLLSLLILMSNCTKPKTVLICGDHVCINKSEANQYFEENLSIEVKIINKKNKNEPDLVELNLREDQVGKRKIRLSSKESTNKKLKILSNKEISKIKKDLKNRNKEKKITKKIIKDNNDFKKKKKVSKKNEKNISKEKNEIFRNNVNKTNKDIVDVCTILEKCSIDEISKYLLNQGKKKSFPDITIRQ